MRKVEFVTVSSLIQQQACRVSNTEVAPDLGNSGRHAIGWQYKLHGHVIGYYRPHAGTLTLRDCGYQTATTKSRLNAILGSLAPRFRVYQAAGDWYLDDRDGGSRDWIGSVTINLDKQAIVE